MNKQLKSALEGLTNARASAKGAVLAYGMIEQTEGVDSPKLERCQTETVNPAHDAVRAAEAALAKASAQTPQEVLAKTSALLHDGLDAEAVERLKADIEAVMIDDPLVDLCKRWKRLHAADVAALVKDDPSGMWSTPEINDIKVAQSSIERQIMQHMPRTPEALSGLLDMYWIMDGPSGLPGTENWAEEMKNPGTQLLQHIRNGAAHIAGLDRDFFGPA